MSSFCKACGNMLRGPRIVVGDLCQRCKVARWLRIIVFATVLAAAISACVAVLRSS
jgi:hypothetical protein